MSGTILRVEALSSGYGHVPALEDVTLDVQQGEIVAVGPGALDDSGKRVAPEVKPGDFVLFGKWSGTEVKIDGEDLLIMKESDIMGVIGKK